MTVTAAQPQQAHPSQRMRIAVLNRSSVMSDDDVHAIVSAMQKHLDQRFAPAWGLSAILTFVPKTDTTSWVDQANLVFLDTSDEANALGYHDLTPQGRPLGKIFAKSDQMYGAKVSVTACHELDEMIVDPNINLTVQANNGVFYAYESDDPVEADEFGEDIDGITMSAFALPSFFEPGSKGPWDSRGVLHAPLTLAPGGYLSYWTPSTGWQQQTLRRSDAANPEVDQLASDRPRVGSRRERRRTPRELWQRSAA